MSRLAALIVVMASPFMAALFAIGLVARFLVLSALAGYEIGGMWIDEAIKRYKGRTR